MNATHTFGVLLAGNPNSGKSSIFNALTGARQHVANYPGATVEKRHGRFRVGSTTVDIIDLPGTYSLSSHSPEERIAQQALLDDACRVVVTVVDSTALRRSLVLFLQILQAGARPVLCLNMSDEAIRGGQVLNLNALRKLLGVPVVETVGHKARGIPALREAIVEAAGDARTGHGVPLGPDLEKAVAVLLDRLAATETSTRGRHWTATRLLVGDAATCTAVRARGGAGQIAVEEATRLREELEARTGRDIAVLLTQAYQRHVDDVLAQVVRSPVRPNARAVSDRIDRVLAHRVWGLPIFLATMYGIFWITFSVGEIPMGWIESAFAALGSLVTSLWPAGTSTPLQSLLVDGIIAGVGGVLVFVPNILLLFVGLALLEDTGYMARAAFLMDRFLSRFGLHGRSFVPMVTGFGCSIPGIMATRTLENEKDRLTTMLVLPLMSCGARLPVWLLLVPAFFVGSWRATMLWGIYAAGIVLALLLALALRRTVLRGEASPFVMELPPYRLPTPQAVLRKTAERGWLYVRKAGTTILGISVVMWVLTSYPKPATYQVDSDISSGRLVVADEALVSGSAAGTRVVSERQVENLRTAEALQHSVAGRLGRAIEPVIRPLGFDWRVGTALIGSFAAKEVFVAQMGIVYSLGAADSDSDDLRTSLRESYSPLAGLSLMLWLLISAPCMATFAVTRRESGSWKWAVLQLAGLTVVGYVVALVVYQVGRLFVE